MCSSCTLQVPVASVLNNVTVIKPQYAGDKADMGGSNVKDVLKGAKQEGGDVTAPVK